MNNFRRRVEGKEKVLESTTYDSLISGYGDIDFVNPDSATWDGSSWNNQIGVSKTTFQCTYGVTNYYSDGSSQTDTITLTHEILSSYWSGVYLPKVNLGTPTDNTNPRSVPLGESSTSVYLENGKIIGTITLVPVGNFRQYYGFDGQYYHQFYLEFTYNNKTIDVASMNLLFRINSSGNIFVKYIRA